MRGRTWKNLSTEQSEKIRELLRRVGTEDEKVTGPREVWRIRVEGGVFNYYETGTLYFAGGEGLAETVAREVSKILEAEVTKVPRECLIGLDETGKGEVLGHAVLAAAVVHRDIMPKVEEILGTADTKISHPFDYWDTRFRELDALRGRGLSFELETLPPWDIDRYNVNKIMDIVYQRLIGYVMLSLDPARCSITLDDYGIGSNLEQFLRSLEKKGAVIRVEEKADVKYTEVRVASLLSKWRRQLAMKKINEKFGFPDAPVGTGNGGDPATLAWLQKWKATGQPWPWFVKTSFETVRKFDGRADKPVKTIPPIRHDLLSQDSRTRFGEGQLSTASLSIICPHCGKVQTAAKLTPQPSGELVGRCLACDEVIEDLDTTLRYYSGVALPDSSVIIMGTISKDLQKKGFFGNFTLLIHPLVSKETDSPGGRKEIASLGDFAAMDRIALKAIEGPTDLPPSDHDNAIIGAAKSSNAILVTRDKGMYGNAICRAIFCLTFRA